MKKCFFSLLPGIALLISGCNNTSNNIDIPEPNPLKTEAVLDLTQLGILAPKSLAVVSDSLYIQSEQGGGNLIFMMAGDTVISGITLGQGNGEILEVASLRAHRGCPDVYDGVRGKINSVHIVDSGLILKEDAVVPRFLDDAVILCDGNILTFPLDKNYSVALLDGNGNIIDSLCYFPPKPSGVSDLTHSLACSGFLGVVDSTHFARSVAYDGGVEFYAIKDEKLFHIRRWSLFDMDYDVLKQGPGVPVPNEKSRSGFQKIVGTDNYFYVSFSSAYALDNPQGVCSVIYVFNKDGELLKLFQPQYEFDDFIVSKDNSKVYLIATDPITEHSI